MSPSVRRISFRCLCLLSCLAGGYSLSAGDLEILHAFGEDPEANKPARRLLLGDDGQIFGVTEKGGANTQGVAYSLLQDGTKFRVLYGFGEYRGGMLPSSGLVRDSDGALYCTTSQVWGYTNGDIYHVPSVPGTAEIIHEFTGTAETGGANPKGELAQRSDGRLFGTTNKGGTYDWGTVYTFNPATHAIATLHSFNRDTEGTPDNFGPIIGADDRLYGVTSTSNSEGGYVYAVAQDGTGFEILHEFTSNDGRPAGELVQLGDGRLYGIAFPPFNGGQGVIYGIDADGTDYTVLHEFQMSEGYQPGNALEAGPDGRLYGVTKFGGPFDGGSIFAINPDGSGFEILHFFNPDTEGRNAAGSLVFGEDGRLYGTNSEKGPGNGGTLFAFTVPTSSAPVVICPEKLEWYYHVTWDFQAGALFGPTSYSIEGTLPPGLEFDDTSALFHGTPTQTGEYPVTIKATNAMGEGSAQMKIAILKLPANVLIDQANQLYDGTPKTVSATAQPAGLNVVVTYDGDPNPPTEIGFYHVVATVDDPNYQGSASFWFAIHNGEAVEPGVVTPLQPQTVEAGDSLTLSVEASGPPPFLYRWYRNSIEFAATTAPSLTIDNITADQAGDYSVSVSNPSVYYGAPGEPVRVIVQVRTENDDFYFTTIAGEAGNTGSAGNTAAKFKEPWGLAVDKDKNVIVADRLNHTIRKVTQAGIVTTIAGKAGETGTADGPGGVARFNGPRSVCLDDAGNIYVSDSGNLTMRKITPDGMVSTLAGQAGVQGSTDGQGAAASFGGLEQIAHGVDGRLYVADTGNKSVRRITLDGLVSTYSPNGAFSSGYPYGVAVDLEGRVYVSDTSRNAIVVIELDRTVRFIAGGASFGDQDGTGFGALFSGPSHICVDAGGNVLVADWNNLKIRRVTPDGVVTSVVGSRNYWEIAGYFDGTGDKARFGYFSGIAIDSEGVLYASNSDWHAIRKITPEGVVTTLAGQPRFPGSADSSGVASLFDMPCGVAVDSNGDLIVADTFNSTIRRVTRDGGSVLLGGRIQQYADLDSDHIDLLLDRPYGVAVLPGGNLIVPDAGSHLIRKITAAGELSILAGGSYEHKADGTGAEANFAAPSGIATDDEGNSYIADRGNGAIRKVTPAGVVTTVGPAFQPTAIARNSSGDFFIACGSAYMIQKLTHDGVLTTFAGKLYESGFVDGPAAEARFGYVNGIAVDDAGYVYVTDWSNHTIRMITPEGIVTTIGGMAGSSEDNDGFRIDSRFNNPWGIAVDDSGAIFVADSGNHTIRMGAHPRAPEFDLQPSEKRAIEGWSVTFEAHADAYPKPTYQWRKGGIDIPGATGAAFTIATVESGDFGNYSVVAANMAGSAESLPARLALPDPPEITTQPNVKTVVLGGSVAYSVSVSGTPPFTYQWKRNGVAITGATNATLTLTNVQAAQGGNYSVTVSNVVGSVTSNAAALTIDTTPRLINVSCRAFAGAGDDTLVMGFYISGTGSKTLLIRGVGPRLSFYNVPSVVADPRISVYKGQDRIDGNDDWDASLASTFTQMGAFELVSGSKDAAMTITLQPGLYTVHLVNDGPVAEGVIEVYDLSRDLGSRLTNVSCRLNMKPDQIVILGTALIGGPAHVLARGVGPGIATYLQNPADALADPHLRVYRGDGEVALNDDWELATRAWFVPTGAFDLPDASKDAALRVPFEPGGYTVHATGKGGDGIAIIELYESP